MTTILLSQFILFPDLHFQNWFKTSKLCPIEVSSLKFLNKDKHILSGWFDWKIRLLNLNKLNELIPKKYMSLQ